MNSTEQILKKITDIEADLSARFSTIDSIAMFEGTTGALVFYYMLDKLHNKEEYKQKFYDILHDLYERINSEGYSKTYCNGLAGIAFALEFFREKKMIEDDDIQETMEFFDDVMIDTVATCSKEINEYDLLHGTFGGLYYLLQRVPNNPSIKERVIEQFEIAAQLIQQDIKSALDYSERVPQPNFGLAHGNISYTIVFSKFLQQFPENQIIRNALKVIVEHQLKFKSKDPSTFSLFPSIVGDLNTVHHNTVLGWCYGDQTVAIGLFMAGTVLNDQEILDQAHAIALHTVKRNTVESSSITEDTDAGLCHGFSSVALNNKLLYEWTGEQAFLDNYSFFTEKVLERGNFPETPSGFKRYYGDGEYKDIVGFLDGTIGIGVFLISTLLENDDTNWERFFLLK